MRECPLDETGRRRWPTGSEPFHGRRRPSDLYLTSRPPSPTKLYYLDRIYKQLGLLSRRILGLPNERSPVLRLSRASTNFWKNKGTRDTGAHTAVTGASGLVAFGLIHGTRTLLYPDTIDLLISKHSERVYFERH